MEDGAAGTGGWWRSPRLIAALACFLLGAVVLLAGLVPRLEAPPTTAEAGLDGLGELGGLEELAGGPTAGPPDDEAAELVVYVTGAVMAPDVYRLPAGARAKDAVLAAGGLRPDAAAERVNLAEPLSDAQQIHVPAIAEAAAEGATLAGDTGLIDLNLASAAELEELPGVGKVLAERIVARREEQGPYTSVEELREVSGVGARLYDQIAPLVSAGP